MNATNRTRMSSVTYNKYLTMYPLLSTSSYSIQGFFKSKNTTGDIKNVFFSPTTKNQFINHCRNHAIHGFGLKKYVK